MDAQSPAAGDRVFSRNALIRSAAFGGGVVAGGALLGGRGDRTSVAARAKDTDADILDLFLLLELVQEGFYREALNRDLLTDDLKTFARIVADQETTHVAFLRRRLDGRPRERARTDFGPMLDTPEAFRDAAIELEEASIAAYIGQGANLSRRAVGDVATLVSVEARQVAWIRDLAGVTPAPRAADPARKADAVIADLRERGFIR
jgi:hypothetical protein